MGDETCVENPAGFRHDPSVRPIGLTVHWGYNADLRQVDCTSEPRVRSECFARRRVWPTDSYCLGVRPGTRDSRNASWTEWCCPRDQSRHGCGESGVLESYNRMDCADVVSSRLHHHPSPTYPRRTSSSPRHVGTHSSCVCSARIRANLASLSPRPEPRREASRLARARTRHGIETRTKTVDGELSLRSRMAKPRSLRGG